MRLSITLLVALAVVLFMGSPTYAGGYGVPSVQSTVVLQQGVPSFDPACVGGIGAQQSFAIQQAPLYAPRSFVPVQQSFAPVGFAPVGGFALNLNVNRGFGLGRGLVPFRQRDVIRHRHRHGFGF